MTKALGLLVALGMTLAGSLISFQVEPAERIAILAQSELNVKQGERRVGVAALGEIYLQAATDMSDSSDIRAATIGNPDITNDQTVLGALHKALDPLPKSGGLYKLRKAFEAISVWILIPLLFFQVAKVAATGVQSDAQIFEIAKKLVIVLVFMSTYTLWDVVVFRMIAIPISSALNKPATFQSVASAITTSRTGKSTAMTGGSKDDNPNGAVMDVAQQVDACNSVIEIANNDQGKKELVADLKTREPTIDVWDYLRVMANPWATPKPLGAWRAVYTRDGSILGVWKSSEEGVGPCHDVMSHGMLRGEMALRQMSGTRKTGWSKGDDASNWLAKTFTGILASAINLLIAGVLWFVWLGIIVGRAFSLCLAPIALAMGMNNLQTANKWFLGHATMVMKPIGITMAVLFVWALNVAIFAGPMPGGTAVGLGAKIALAIITMVILVKSNGLSKIAAGDVTQVATQMASAVSDRATQVTATGVKGLAAGAGYLKNGGAQELRDRFAKNRASGQSMLRGGNKGWSAIRQGLGTGVGDVRSIIGGTVDAAKWMGKNRAKDGEFTAGKVPSWQSMKGVTTDAYKGAAVQMKQGKTVMATGQTADALKDAAEKRKQHQQIVAKMPPGTKLGVRPGETMTVDHSSLKSGKDLPKKDQEKVANLLDRGFEGVMGITNGAKGLSYAEGKNGGIKGMGLGAETLPILMEAFDNDPELNRLGIEAAAADWGGEDKVPTKEGANGKVLDIAEASKKSPVLSAFLAQMSEATTKTADELIRRELLSQEMKKATGVPESSLTEYAVREADPAFTTDAGLNGETLKTIGEQFLREAWYKSATPEERNEVGLPEDGGAEGAKLARYRQDLMERDIPVLKNAGIHGSGDQATPQFRENLQVAVSSRVKELDDLQRRVASPSEGGEGLGFQKEIYLRTGEVSYLGKAGSIYSQVTIEQPDMNDEEIYNIARKRAEKIMNEPEMQRMLSKKLVKQPSEKAEDYEARVEAEKQKAIFIDIEGYKAEVVKADAQVSADEVTA